MNSSPQHEQPMPRWIAVASTLLFLALGVGGAAVLVKTKSKPAKEPEAVTLPMVRAQTVRVGTQALQLEAQGIVQPARQIMLQPEVAGRIVWHASELVPGGQVRAGQPLVRIDARDYALALRQQQAQVESQKLTLQIEESRKRIAEQEWLLFKQGRDGSKKAPSKTSPGNKATTAHSKSKAGPSLALREPHLKTAKVALQAAQSSAQRAQLNLSRTMMVAPFNAFVQMERVDLGQLVGPQSQLATLVGTDAFWVQVSLPVDKLAYVKLPRGDEPGSAARVWLDVGQDRVERQGHVVRLLGDLGPGGRMARIIVRIEDPFGLKTSSPKEPSANEANDADTNPSSLPMLLGAYVHVELEGKMVNDVINLPRRALRDDETIWSVDDKDQLVISKARVVWGTDEEVIVRAPLKTGSRVIVSRLAAPVVGMKLRVSDVEGASPSAPEGPKGAKAQ